MKSALFAGCIVALAATATFAEITVTTATGAVTLAAPPQTVAAYDVAAIDTMTALDIAVTGAPATLYVSYLDSVAQDAAPVGTLFEPDYEKLAILAPDLIVVGSRSSELADPLSRVAPVIDMSIAGTGILDQTRARIAAFGTLFGKEDRATALAATLDQKLGDARAAVHGKGNALIVLTNGNKISAFGEGSRFGWLHTDLGLPMAAQGLAAETHGQAISFEFIEQTDPDWLIVIDRGAAIGQEGAAQATLDNPLVAKTRAAQSGQIVYLDAAPIYVAGGGAMSVMRTLDELTAAVGG
ncbi:siderophore ABC transporter substrate-binding protein [Actibacterium ureilyticum]|uniref:siderophore ABC transporter substrate-binding protein n=1 Tax=Actibacterium ureilyticum TaxID=1590614 RepID=UPI000BAAB694|nr:siderophore ABC transporter substrate-binding protein [Actibacterium ureilyticum]